jgi:ABC-type multidrug transport system permease subunit
MLASMSVSPVLYMVAFVYAMGHQVMIEGRPYAEFLVPGLVAMSAMMQSFSISGEINISRFYWHTFEEFQAAPLSGLAYVVGEVMAGVTKALAGVVIILGTSALFGVVLYYGPYFWLAVLLECLVFASLAVCLAMLVKSHADQSLLTNFVITPMAFLSGTFFPVERFPDWAQTVVALSPLTHASHALRAASYGQTPSLVSYLVLVGSGLLFFALGWLFVAQARD